jgi:hypothetical protein
MLSLLALCVASFLSGYIYLSVQAGRALRGSEFARFFNTIVKSVTHANEGGAFRALQLSKQALSSAPSSGSIDIDGQTYSFPLPQYAVPQEKSQYAAALQESEPGRFYFLGFVSPDEMQNYFDRDLPRAGWTQVDQMGSGHFLQGHGARMTIVQHFYLTSDISEFVVIVGRP